jgi:hypothetical protein
MYIAVESFQKYMRDSVLKTLHSAVYPFCLSNAEMA